MIIPNETVSFHHKLNGTLPTQPVQQVAIELLDTQVVSGSVQWVMLEISWNHIFLSLSLSLFAPTAKAGSNVLI